MGQKITSDGSDSKRQINLEKFGAAGQVFRVLGFRRKVRDFHRPREYVCVGKWFAWVACEYLSPRHLQTFPKRINENSTLPSVPGAHFSQTNREKASFHSFPRLSLIANSLRRLKVQVMADLFYCKQDSGGCESCRHYLARFSRLRAFGNIFVKKKTLSLRDARASSLVIPWAASNTLFSSISVPIKVLRCTRHIVFDCSQLWQITDEIVERRWHRTVFVAISSPKTCFEAWNCSNGSVANVYRRFEHKKLLSTRPNSSLHSVHSEPLMRLSFRVDETVIIALRRLFREENVGLFALNCCARVASAVA